MEKRAQIRERATVYDLGDIVEVDVSAYRRRGKGRHGKWKRTSESKAYLNRMARRRFFRRKAMLNFRWDARIMTLTYDDEHLPETEERLIKDVEAWKRSCQRAYRRAGLEFKAMWVYDFGEESHRAHIHVICNGGIEERDLISRWRRGHDWIDAMEYSETGIEDLCAYMDAKESFRHGYGCTRNLKQPKPVDEREELQRRISKVFTKERCEEISEGALTRGELNGLFPGFQKVLDGYSCRYNPYSRSYNLHLRLLRPYAQIEDWAKTREFREMELTYAAYAEEKEQPLMTKVMRGYVDMETGEVFED